MTLDGDILARLRDVLAPVLCVTSTAPCGPRGGAISDYDVDLHNGPHAPSDTAAFVNDA